MTNLRIPSKALLLKSLILCLCFSIANSTNITLTVLNSLASTVNESSGFHYHGANDMWTHNDSGGSPKLYRLNSSGSVTKTITVSNTTNVDWEDITTDSARTKMFVGDFGNNNNNRTNLKIYIIPHPSTVSGTTVSAQTINFTYPDQTVIPSPITNWNFDMEGFIHYRGMIYLFSKCGGNPLSLYTKLYSMPDSAGTYTATLIDSFYTGTRITSATVSPDGESIILLGNNNIHIFRNWTGNNFLSGNFYDLSETNGWTQKEACSFRTSTDLLITDENTGAGNFVYLADLSQWLPVLTSTQTLEAKVDFSLWPNPAHHQLKVKNEIQGAMLSILDAQGKIVLEESLNTGETALNISHLSTGVYMVMLRNKVAIISRKKIVVQ